MEVVEIGDKLLVLEKEKSESREQFYERVWLIVNNFEKYSDNIDKLICLSKIWSNVKYLNCRYDVKLMDEINSLKLTN